MSVLRKGAWALADNAAAALLAFGFFIVLARVLPAQAFGVAAMALSVMQILTPMVESLFHDALVQREGLDKADRRAGAQGSLAFGAALAVMVWAGAPLIAAAARTPDLALYLPWMAPALVFSGLYAAPAALARREGRFRTLAFRTLAARGGATVVGIVLALKGFGVWAMAAQYVLTAAASALFLAASEGLHLGGPPPWGRWPGLLRFGAPLMGAQALIFAAGRLATLIVGAVLGPAAAGTWSLALRLVEPAQMLAAATLGQTALSIYARRQDDRAQLGRLFVAATRSSMLVLAPLFVGLALTAPLVVDLLAGPRWAAAAPLTSLAALAALVALSRQLAESVLTAAGRPQLNLRTQAQAAALSLAGAAAGAPFGLGWAAAGWALRIAPFLSSNIAYLRAETGLSATAQLRPLVLPLAACAVMAAAVGAARSLLSPQPAALALTACIGIGGAAYAAAVLAFSRQWRARLARR